MKRALMCAALAVLMALPCAAETVMDGFAFTLPEGFTVVTPDIGSREAGEGVIFAAENEGGVLAVIRRAAERGEVDGVKRLCRDVESVSYDGEAVVCGARFSLFSEIAGSLSISVAMTELDGYVYTIAYVENAQSGAEADPLRSFMWSFRLV